MTESQILDGVNSSATSSKASSPVPSAPNAPRYGTVIPNRIFVGGVAFNTSEAELKNFFSAFGHVKETKIISDRAGVSKGYGFVTFESQDEALRILKEQPNSLIFKDKKLNIGQAIRKQPVSFPKNVDPALIPNGMVLHSPSGYSYTYHNGVAYFNPNEMQTSPGHPAAAVAHHTHTPHRDFQTPSYAPYNTPYTIPVRMMPAAATHHQYITEQPQPYTTYAPPVSSTATPQWTPPQAQWRWVHPSQLPKPISAGTISGGLMSPIYAAAPATHAPATHAASAGPDGMVYSANIYQSPEVAEAIPMIEPAPAEGAVIATANQIQVAAPQLQHQPPPIHPLHAPQHAPLQFQPPPPGIMAAAASRPYLTTADLAYTDPIAFQALMQPRTVAPQHNKYAAKRPIQMPRRDRAPKAFRSAVDGVSYAVHRSDDVSSGEN